MSVRPLHIKNAHIWGRGEQMPRDLYTSDVVLDKPVPDALIVDLDGYTFYPGLINAHDHLELNHYPRSKFCEVYDNAHQWGEDMNVRLNDSPYRELRAYPLEDRLFIGGLKNLLCGATTVAHHNPPHEYLFREDFPVRVLKKYGWAHSLHFSTDEEIVNSYRSTPLDVPWFIHLAEGTDEVAAGEYKRLKALGCVGKNTVIVHGVGIKSEDVEDAVASVRGLVWCPSTNNFLLGKTSDFVRYTYVADRPSWRAGSHVAIGSDSRLTADGDLLNEMVAAVETSQCDRGCILEAVTSRAAHILGLTDVGHLNIGARADWIFLSGYSRSAIEIVVKGGVPQIGNPDLMAKFPHIQTVPATLDGIPKAIHIELARRIIRCTLKEPGLEIDPDFRAGVGASLRKIYWFMRTRL